MIVLNVAILKPTKQLPEKLRDEGDGRIKGRWGPRTTSYVFTTPSFLTELRVATPQQAETVQNHPNCTGTILVSAWAQCYTVACQIL